MTFKLRNPAILLPKFNVVTVDHLPGAFSCPVVVIADEIDGLHEMAVTADKVRSIVRHIRALPSYWRPEFTVEPTTHVGLHGVTRDDHRLNAITLRAREGAVVEARRSRLDL